jgi:tryptophan synthase beta chain
MPNTEKWLLSPAKQPRHWLNVAALVKEEFPLPRDEAGNEVSQKQLESMYSTECARIELLAGPYREETQIEIPEFVGQLYARYRPTPLFRAVGLERHLGYSGPILFKREDLNPSGSHKPNTAIPQAYYAREQGLRELITDTGAGQWGAALAWACWRAGLASTVFMTRNSFITKPYRPLLMELSSGTVHPSPSELTERGRALLAADPEHVGSLGIGMGEALDTVMSRSNSRLALGCMSYYAALHQTIVGCELVHQLESAEYEPDVLVGCVGGGTNLFGFAAPWIADGLQSGRAPEIVAAESANVPALTQGEYRYDFADSFALTPKVLMYTLGHDFVPPHLHSAGLRYHGKSPIVSLLVRKGHIRPTAVSQDAAFAACRLFFEVEGILPAPESGHAIAAVLDEVTRAQLEGRIKTIVFCLSGTGYLDLEGYASIFELR